MTFSDWLHQLQGPAIEAVVGLLMSVAGEYLPSAWWQGLAAKYKRAVYLILCLGVPVAAAAVSAACGYQPASIDATYWPALQAGAIVFAASQAAHLPRL
jgi:hypothetical protein